MDLVDYSEEVYEKIINQFEEFSSKLSDFGVKSQWDNTKYARYLEGYSKSFEFIQKTQNYYKDLKNQIDKPSNVNVKK